MGEVQCVLVTSFGETWEGGAWLLEVEGCRDEAGTKTKGLGLHAGSEDSSAVAKGTYGHGTVLHPALGSCKCSFGTAPPTWRFCQDAAMQRCCKNQRL